MSRSSVVSRETLKNAEESRAISLAEDSERCRTISGKTRTLKRRDKERYGRGFAEDVESSLDENDLRPFRALKKLRSKSTFQTSTIRNDDGQIISDVSGSLGRVLSLVVHGSAQRTAFSGWVADHRCWSTNTQSSTLSCGSEKSFIEGEG